MTYFSAGVVSGWILGGEQHETLVSFYGLLRLGDEEFAVVVE